MRESFFQLFESRKFYLFDIFLQNELFNAFLLPIMKESFCGPPEHSDDFVADEEHRVLDRWQIYKGDVLVADEEPVDNFGDAVLPHLYCYAYFRLYRIKVFLKLERIILHNLRSFRILENLWFNLDREIYWMDWGSWSSLNVGYLVRIGFGLVGEVNWSTVIWIFFK